MILIFDLDNTIYSPESGLFKAVDNRINLYLKKYLKIPENKVNELRKNYWLKYGTTLNGLMRFHNINPVHYLEFVHDVEINEFLKEDEELKKIFSQIDCKKFIFTNGYKPFALNVLNSLGIINYFDEVFDILWMNYIPKPKIYGYLKLLKTLKVSGKKCIIFDDFPLNLLPAKWIEMTTILVNKRKINYSFIDRRICKIKELKNLHFIVDI